MVLRWTAAGMLEAERQFRRITGYRDLAKLATAVEREVTQTVAPPRPRSPLHSSRPDHHTPTAVAKFHDERDILNPGLRRPQDAPMCPRPPVAVLRVTSATRW